MAREIFELRKLSAVAAHPRTDKDPYDLSDSEFVALDALSRTDSMTVGELQKKVGVLPAQMSRIIRSLESKADKPLVTCTLNPDDKRKIDVAISDTGRRAYQAYQAARLGRTMHILADLEESDRLEFIRILRLIRKKFENAIRKPTEQRA